MILVIAEHLQGKLNKMSLEALAAAKALGKELNRPVEALVAGGSVAAFGAEIPAAKLHVLEHSLLDKYTPDAFCAALRQAVENLNPWLVLLPHTYQVRDFAPKLAASLGKAFVSDVIGHRIENGELLLTRQLFAGKVNCDVAFAGPPPYFASVQAGAFRPAEAGAARETAKIEVTIDAAAVRNAPEEWFQEAKRSVDLSQAELIVAVGRGIKEPQHLDLAQQLCAALGAELAASRPICDSGWLPMERQIGSSGQTVAPKLYLALGISGAIQHLVGMKGSRCVVAVNKDQNAPIFEVSDYGIVGNLFDVVPALIEELKRARG
jgi:electron transfer flavoprotein alpha subunit